jgi:hypothetical protein
VSGAIGIRRKEKKQRSVSREERDKEGIEVSMTRFASTEVSAEAAFLTSLYLD